MNLTVMQDGSERVSYEEPAIPLYVRRGDLKQFSGMAALCHWHDDVELLLPLRGHLRYNVNGNLTDVGERQAIFVNARQMHFGYSADGTDCQYVCIAFRPQGLWGNEMLTRRFTLPVLSAAQFPCLLLKEQALLDPIHRLDALYQTRDPGFELLALSALAAFWQGLYVRVQRETELSPAGDGNLRALRQMLDCIRTRYAERLTLETVAAAGGVCRTRCCQLFRQYLNRTPNDYLTSFRLEKGMELLRSTSLPVTEIAAACGFSGSSYFAERFSQAKGCSPTQYRRK